MEKYHIVFQDGAPEDWGLAADTLAASAGMNRTEAAKACRRGYGLILHPFEREQAEAGAAALTQVGIGAKSLAASELVQAPPAINVLSIAIEEHVLRCEPAISREPFDVPVENVRIVCAGNFMPGKQKNEKQALAEIALASQGKSAQENASSVVTGLAVGAVLLGGAGPVAFLGAQHLAKQADPRNSEPAAAVSRTAEVCVDLVCVNPLARLRFTQRRYNYQTLGARRLPNMRGNFRLVLNDLLAALPDAIPVGQVTEAASGANLEQDKFIREDSDLCLELTAVLTREAQFGE